MEEGFVQKLPNTFTSLSGGFHSYLWLFKAQTSSSGSGEGDSRKTAVFKLVRVEESDVNAGTFGTLPGVDTTAVLTYEQIF